MTVLGIEIFRKGGAIGKPTGENHDDSESDRREDAVADAQCETSAEPSGGVIRLQAVPASVSDRRGMYSTARIEVSLGRITPVGHRPENWGLVSESSRMEVQ